MADKAEVTWKGESDAEDAPKETSYGHLRFVKGEAVEVEDPRIIEKLRGNKFFEVVGGPQTATPGPVTYQNLAPSQQDSQGAAAKPGEPASSPPQPALPVSSLPTGAPLAKSNEERLREHREQQAAAAANRAPAERHSKK